MMLSQIVAEAGFEVVQAANGMEALSTLDRVAPSLGLVMVDWHMPQMSGVEFVQQMRANPAFSQVPVVMVTTNHDIEHIAHALEAGANEYVMKPFTRAIIQDKLRLLGLMK
jgi:two-component system chemotaxis response regulator CheY